MNPLWTAEEAKEATQGKSAVSWQASGVSIDTRTLEKGDLFVALKGEHSDGHDYIEEAFAKGAAAAVVSHASKEVEDKPYLLVPGTQEALWDLADFSRERAHARFIAITGSVGKTTVKEALRAVCEAQGNTHANLGNLNNHLGLPLSLARMPADTEYGVFELGMNHAGELSELTDLLQPDVTLITTVEAVHLEFFDSVEDIARAKAEIIEGLKPGGIAILPHDNPHFTILEEKAKEHEAKIITFGSGDADIQLIETTPTPDGQEVKAQIHGKEISYTLPLLGSHQAINSLAVVATADAVGIKPVQTIEILENLEQVEGRGKQIQTELTGKAITLLDDSYNASPASMKASLEVLSQLKQSQGSRAIAVLGDMLELGEESPALHAGLAESIQANNIDLVFTAGPLMANLADVLACEHKPEALKLLPALEKAIEPGDIVLIKGSHGSNMWQLAHAICEGETVE